MRRRCSRAPRSRFGRPVPVLEVSARDPGGAVLDEQLAGKINFVVLAREAELASMVRAAARGDHSSRARHAHTIRLLHVRAQPIVPWGYACFLDCPSG